ncbi:hypothetical protein K439DRAFT_1618156 [Ramaria rubella]|nr:hypothetical protein K439DRAFT_1618156 [Ramaria rubella]
MHSLAIFSVILTATKGTFSAPLSRDFHSNVKTQATHFQEHTPRASCPLPHPKTKLEIPRKATKTLPHQKQRKKPAVKDTMRAAGVIPVNPCPDPLSNAFHRLHVKRQSKGEIITERDTAPNVEGGIEARVSEHDIEDKDKDKDGTLTIAVRNILAELFDRKLTGWIVHRNVNTLSSSQSLADLD